MLVLLHTLKLIVSELRTSLAVKTHVDLILKELVSGSEK